MLLHEWVLDPVDRNSLPPFHLTVGKWTVLYFVVVVMQNREKINIFNINLGISNSYINPFCLVSLIQERTGYWQMKRVWNYCKKIGSSWTLSYCTALHDGPDWWVSMCGIVPIPVPRILFAELLQYYQYITHRDTHQWGLPTAKPQN